MLNFNFSEKAQGLVSPTHFVYEFSRKIFLMLHFNIIILTDQISLAECVLQLFVNEPVTSQNLKLTLSFLSSRLLQKFIYLNNEKSFCREIKSIIHYF